VQDTPEGETVDNEGCSESPIGHGMEMEVTDDLGQCAYTEERNCMLIVALVVKWITDGDGVNR